MGEQPLLPPADAVAAPGGSLLRCPRSVQGKGLPCHGHPAAFLLLHPPPWVGSSPSPTSRAPVLQVSIYLAPQSGHFYFYRTGAAGAGRGGSEPAHPSPAAPGRATAGHLQPPPSPQPGQGQFGGATFSVWAAAGPQQRGQTEMWGHTAAGTSRPGSSTVRGSVPAGAAVWVPARP